MREYVRTRQQIAAGTWRAVHYFCFCFFGCSFRYIFCTGSQFQPSSKCTGGNQKQCRSIGCISIRVVGGSLWTGVFFPARTCLVLWFQPAVFWLQLALVQMARGAFAIFVPNWHGFSTLGTHQPGDQGY